MIVWNAYPVNRRFLCVVIWTNRVRLGQQSAAGKLRAVEARVQERFPGRPYPEQAPDWGARYALRLLESSRESCDMFGAILRKEGQR